MRYDASPANTMAHTQPSIRLQLLGLPSIALDAGSVPLGASRATQLLAHLAVRGSWQSRDEVARLFWPDSPNKVARSNLRNLLCKTVAAAPFAPIEATDHALRLQATSDLNDFEAAVQRGDSEAAVRIGSAELLQGLEAHASEPYLLWLQAARVAQAAQWTKAVQALLAQTARPLDQREALAAAWASHCPFDEEAVHAQVALAFERRQAGTAAAIFKAFELRLQEELGVQPSRALERFALEQAPMSAPTSAPGDQPSAPRPAASTLAPGPTRTRLFGRRFEMSQLKSLLADKTLRLITLTGPGGVGKSTLMAALFEQCAADSEASACLVDASAAQSPQAVIAAIATALGIEGLQGAGNEVALAATLRDRRCLLMIDGAEQEELAVPLALLLDRCPQTRLLIASRSRLQLDNEHVLVLDGFPLPDADETDMSVLDSNDAVCYFIDVMGHAGRPVNLAHDASTLAALVHAVEGLPLALKLLAKLARMFSLPQLLQGVQEQMAGHRAAGSPALGELMPALVASFQRSWTALTPPEQAVLARLAVFPAPFDVAAARAVAGTELPLITSLVDRSLVRAAGAGRLSLHAGIRACVLAANPRSEGAMNAYIEFYTQRFAELVGLSDVKSVRPLNTFLRDDGAHVEYIWRLALQSRIYPALLSMAESLRPRFVFQSDTGDYLAWLSEAEGLFRDDPNVPPALRAFCLAGAARLAWTDGKDQLMMSLALDALRFAKQARHHRATCDALTMLTLAHMAGIETAKEAKLLIDRLAALVGNNFDSGLLDMRSLFSHRSGDCKEALRLQDKIIANAERLEDSTSVVFALIAKWNFAVDSNDFPEATHTMNQALEKVRKGDVSSALEVCLQLTASQWYLELGQIDKSRSRIARANTITSSRPQSPNMHLKTELTNAAINVTEGHWVLAAERLTTILAEIGRHEVPFLANNAFVYTAKWFQLAGDRNACLGVLRAVQAGFFTKNVTNIAQQILRELGEEPQPRSEAMPGSPQVDIAEVAMIARRRMLVLVDEIQRSKQP